MRTGKKYFKDGNPEVYAYINDATWKRLTDREKSKWTPYSDVEHVPIPKEVLEFNNLRDEADKKDQALKDEIEKLKSQIAESKSKVELEINANVKPVEVEVKPAEDELDEKEQLLAECREKGLKVTANMKVETLRNKLNDANNSEQEVS